MQNIFYTISDSPSGVLTRDRATYICPAWKHGRVKSTVTSSNVNPCDLCMDNAYASLNGYCSIEPISFSFSSSSSSS